jgi:hypothetical protein
MPVSVKIEIWTQKIAVSDNLINLLNETKEDLRRELDRIGCGGFLYFPNL